MINEYKVPSPGESISEVEITNWMVSDGDFVNKNDELAEVESDKATLLLVAEESGIISIKVAVGQTVAVGTVAYTIDISAVKEENKKSEITVIEDVNIPIKKEINGEVVQVKVTPIAAEMMKDNNLSVEEIIEGLRRISKSEVQAVIKLKENAVPFDPPVQHENLNRNTERSKMSMLRRRLSERLVAVKNETAMLTTFNEVDMSRLMELKSKYQNQVVDKYGFKPGFMGFFTKAVSVAALKFPSVNSQIDRDEIVTPSYVDVGIAVQSPKGLMVPIVRNAQSKTVIEIEKDIKELAQKARDKKIGIEELTGGTISITNGGVFGSLLSTPILNPPQSAILGMHNIVDRPIAVNGQVVIRPMMYVALSYDHRIIDGKDSVGFLKTVKELIENPERLLFNGADPAERLFDL